MVDLIYLRLSAITGLLGNITPELRAASVFINEENEDLVVVFFYDGVINDELEEAAYLATTEIGCGFPWLENGEVRMSDTQIVRVDFPEPIPLVKHLVYLRHETGCEAYRELVSKEVFPVINSVNMRLAGMRALLGRVTPNIRRIYVYEEEKSVCLHFYFHGEIAERDRELAKEALNEVMTSFQSEKLFEVRIERLDFPQKLPQILYCLYARAEG